MQDKDNILVMKENIQKMESEQKALIKRSRPVRQYVALQQNMYLEKLKIEQLKEEMEERCNICDLTAPGCFFGYNCCPLGYKSKKW